MIELACKRPQDNRIAICEEGTRALGFKADALSDVLVRKLMGLPLEMCAS